MNGNQQITTPVLIVGAGPVGLSLAVELGRRGIECLLIEQQAQHFVGFPTTNNISIRTMEHLRRWGIADRVRDAVATLPYSRQWLTSVGGYLLVRQDYPPNGEAVPLPFSPEPYVWCPKPFFDPILAELASGFSSVYIRFGWRFLSYEQDETGVTAAIEEVATGSRHTVHAAYLAGCDGAGSEVRRQAGLERIGLFANRGGDRGLTIYFRAPKLASRLPMMAAHTHLMHPRFKSGRGGPPVLVAIDGAETWRTAIPPGAVGENFDLTAYMHDLIGEDVDIEVLETTRATANNRSVNDHYRNGRVFVAGDAAHLNTARGGLAANMGMQDAVDLGWKLSAVLQGWGGGHLLDSYEVERRPVALQLLRYQGMDIVDGQAVDVPIDRFELREEVPDYIEEDTPEAAEARRQVALGIWRVHHGHQDHPGLETGYRYDDSPICVPDGTPAPPDEITTYTQSARPGSRAPHAWLTRELSTLDLFGDTFTLLRIGGDILDTRRLEEGAASRGLPLKLADVHWQELWTLYEARLALVRPDGYVAWRGDEIPADALELIDRVRGALSPDKAAVPQPVPETARVST